MYNCCVFGCSNKANHAFPRDKKTRKLWEAATKCKDFRANKHSKICAAHFKPEDFCEIGRYSGLQNTRRILKKSVVPSVFTWSTAEGLKSKNRRQRAELRDSKRKIEEASTSSNTSCRSNSSTTTVTLDDNVYCVGEVVIKEENAILSNSQLTQSLNNDNPSYQECGTQKNYQFFTVESFRNDNRGISFYTGFESFEKFIFVFNTLCPEAYSLKYKSSQVLNLSSEDQFLLTLIKLKKNKEDYELGRFFDISSSTVSNIFITWINFMYQMWSMLDIWPTRELVDFYMPEGFKKLYPSTRVIVDCTEIPIERPANPAAQRAVWSSYKNRSTVKLEVGASPSGLISHCSEAYAGSTSDRQIVERSQLLQKCGKGDSIMADRGFNVQDIFAHKGVAINIPTFLKGKNQLPGMTVIQDRKLSSKRVHIERLIGLTKTYCILKNPVNFNYVPIMSKIYFVCAMMCNFRESIVTSKA